MKYINLTPYTINEAVTGKVFQPYGLSVRVSEKMDKVHEHDGVVFFNSVQGKAEIVDNATKEVMDDNSFYCWLLTQEHKSALIVSAMAKESFKELLRNNGYNVDLLDGIFLVVSPGDPVRDSEGKIIGCKGFKL